MEIENYSFSKYTEVYWRDEWHEITEVWFDEKKVGIKDTGHLISFDEITNIRN